MYEQAGTWAVVLAAGEGSRLRMLTKGPGGANIPKQFCSLCEGPSLLEEALARARAVTSDLQTVPVVAAQHRQWWEPLLWSLPPDNIVSQPANLGTANGILLPLLHINHRAPNARVVILPSDHHVRQEHILIQALNRAIEQTLWRWDETLLLAIQPDEVDPDLGYILPGRTDGRGALEVRRFIEKPNLELAKELLGQGALWNSFIIVATVQALLALFHRRLPELVGEMRAAVQQDLQAPSQGAAVAELYTHLPVLDFSRDILQGEESQLRVLPVPSCGWSDLGTPQRVARALGRMSDVRSSLRRSLDPPAYLSLASQYARNVVGDPLSCADRSPG